MMDLSNSSQLQSLSTSKHMQVPGSKDGADTIVLWARDPVKVKQLLDNMGLFKERRACLTEGEVYGALE